MFYHPHVDPLYLQLWLCTAVVCAKSSILHIWPAELGLYPGNPKWNCLNQLYELSLDNQELRRCAVPRDLNTMNRETGRCVGTHLNIVANNRPELCGWWLECRSAQVDMGHVILPRPSQNLILFTTRLLIKSENKKMFLRIWVRNVARGGEPRRYVPAGRRERLVCAAA